MVTKKKLGRKIVTKMGCIYVCGFGVKKSEMDEIFNEKWSKW